MEDKDLDFSFDEAENNTGGSEVEATDNVFDNFENNQVLDEDFSATPEVNYNNMASEPEKKNGLKIFFTVLCCVVALSLAVGAGYIMGKNPASFSSPEDLFVEQIIELEDLPEDDTMSPAGIYNKCNSSIVGIVVYNSAGEGSNASGVIYTEDGYIITNDHIYDDIPSPKFKIYTSDNKEYNAVYVGGDTRSDVAVLKIMDTNDKFTAASFGDSEKLIVGQRVVAIGRPMDATAHSSITEGIISLLDARVTSSSNYSNPAIQTNTAINPGSSGGALFNMYGQVIGITSSKIVGDEYEGMGYAIPSASVKKIAESLVQYGKVVNRAKIGISYYEVDSVTAEIGKYDAVGLYVAEVTNSALTSVLSKGDIITEVNSQKITSDRVILDIIDKSLPGQSLDLTVLKTDGTTKHITAKLLADEGSSSLDSSAPSKNENSDQKDKESNGSSFTFPFGD